MRKVGVEEEFLLVRKASEALAPLGDEAVAAAERDSEGQFEHELKREQVELGSQAHESLTDLADDLRGLRTALAEGAERAGTRLAALATSPLQQHNTVTPDERYETMTALYGVVGRNLLTCGMHVHVDIASPDEGVHVLDRLRPMLPLLRALSANSPYAAGQDTGFASYRTVLWGQWPSAGVTDPFGDLAGYEASKAALIRSGAALDDGMIYFDARLSTRYPTVEIRVADVCPSVDDAVTLAGLARAMVNAAAEAGPVPAVRTELLRAAHWRAARWGMDGELLDPGTGELVAAWDLLARTCDAISLGDDEAAVTKGLADLRDRGTGSRLQRDAYARRRVWSDVVDAVVARTVS